MSVSDPRDEVVEAAMGALNQFAATLLKSGVSKQHHRSILAIAWETARSGDALLGLEEEHASAALTTEETALCEIGAICIAGAIEAAVVGVPHFQTKSRSPGVRPWEWIRWRVDACARAASAAGLDPNKCEALRNIGASLLEPYRLEFDRVERQQAEALRLHQLREKHLAEQAAKEAEQLAAEAQQKSQRVKELQELQGKRGSQLDPELRAAADLELKELEHQLESGFRQGSIAADLSGTATSSPAAAHVDARESDSAVATRPETRAEGSQPGQGAHAARAREVQSAASGAPTAAPDHEASQQEAGPHARRVEDASDFSTMPEEPAEVAEGGSAARRPSEGAEAVATASSPTAAPRAEEQAAKELVAPGGAQAKKEGQQRKVATEEASDAQPRRSEAAEELTSGTPTATDTKALEGHGSEAKTAEQNQKSLWVEPSGCPGPDAAWMGPLSVREVLKLAEAQTLGPEGLVWGLAADAVEPPDARGAQPLWQCLPELGNQLRRASEVRLRQQLEQRFKKAPKQAPEEDATDILPGKG